MHCEICGVEIFGESKKVVVEGYLQQRSWQTSEGIQKRKTEIVAEKINFPD